LKIEKKVLELISLKGRVAMISGAASGIGFAAAKRLAEMGANIVLLDIDESRGKEAEKEIRKMGVGARFLRCDVRSDADCRKAVEDAYKEFLRIDILFNNAGVVVRKDIVDVSEDEWDKVLDINLKGVYLLSHYVIPHMIKNGRGSIINTGSGWGLKGGPNAAAYCASKGGVVNLTRAMAIDCGKHNVRVNCVCPGDTDTAMLHNEAAQLGEDYAKFMKEAAERPLNRVGQPEEIANAVLFLASDVSSFVTGSILVVDGGGTA
jgi:NAD(P)-dependent dehydrogenase (short-subunit alcohol dehydrogenase family)